MAADRVRRRLRRWHLATVVVAMTSASAGISLAILGPDSWVPLTALVGWAIPLVLHGFLGRSSEAVGARPTSVGLAIGAIFLGFFLMPVMLHQTAKRVGDAVADPALATRQVPLLVAWLVSQFAPGFVSVFLGFGVAFAITSVLQTLLLAAMTASIQRAVVEHVELQDRGLDRVGDATGHRVPVAVRS